MRYIGLLSLRYGDGFMNVETAGNVINDLLNDYRTFSAPHVRLIHNLEELRLVYKLTHLCFTATGYFKPHSSKMIMHHPHFDHIPQTQVFVAVMNGIIVGSISITFDGPAGLTIEDEYKEQCAVIRSEGQRLATVWRLIVDPAVRSNRAVLMSLIDTVVVKVRERGIPVALFSVNPKHERVYCQMLKMEVVARKLQTEEHHVPSVLLRVDGHKIPMRRDAHHRGLVFNPIHSLIAHGF